MSMKVRIPGTPGKFLFNSVNKQSREIKDGNVIKTSFIFVHLTFSRIHLFLLLDTSTPSAFSQVRFILRKNLNLFFVEN